MLRTYCGWFWVSPSRHVTGSHFLTQRVSISSLGFRPKRSDLQRFGIRSRSIMFNLRDINTRRQLADATVLSSPEEKKKEKLNCIAGKIACICLTHFDSSLRVLLRNFLIRKNRRVQSPLECKEFLFVVNSCCEMLSGLHFYFLVSL